MAHRGIRLGVAPGPAALRSRGALADAADELHRAIAQIERVSEQVFLEEQRATFRADKWDVYVELALVERARGRTEAAFETSERLRERQLLDLLARGRVTEDQASPALAGREQDLRRKIGALAQRLDARADTASGLRDAARPDPATEATRAALSKAQEAYSALLLEMREANPAYAALVRGEIAPVEAVRAALAPDEAFLEYLVGDSTTIVFVVTSDTLVAVDLHVTHDALATRIDFARGTLTSPTAGSTSSAWHWRASSRFR